MKDRNALRERYLQDKLSVQLGNLASNLAHIASYSGHPEHREIVEQIIEDSKFFIEWSGPAAKYEQQLELVDLQIQLARWQLRWSEIWADPLRRATVAAEARQWSERVLALSGLLDESVNNEQAPDVTSSHEQNSETDSPAAQEWRALSEKERQQHIEVMDEMYSPDSPASRAVIENRRGSWGEPTRTEVIARLVSEALIPQPGSWDDKYARAWRNRSAEERQRLITEMHNLNFPDSFASQLIAQDRR
jgi:hypothetical protein